MESRWLRWKLVPYSTCLFFCFFYPKLAMIFNPTQIWEHHRKFTLEPIPIFIPDLNIPRISQQFCFFRNNFEAMGPPSPRALRGASEPSHHPPSASRSHLSLKLGTKLPGELFCLWLKHVNFTSKMVKSWVHSWHITWNFGFYMHIYNTIQ